MRSEGVVSAVLAGFVVVAVASCGGDDEASLDLESIDAELVEPVEPGTPTVGVSPLGKALVSGDGQTCIVELDGTEGPCLDLDVQDAQVRWSPDGTRAVVQDERAFASFQDIDLTVIDMEEATFDVIADDGTDDPSEADIDFAPVWLDDDTIAYLRREGFDGDLQRVTLELGGEPIVHDVDLGEANPFPVGAPLGDQLLVLAGRGGPAELLAIAEDGSTDEVLDLDGSFSVIGESSSDRRAVAVPTGDVRTLRPGPVAYLELDEAPVLSGFDAVSAVVSPDGELVAALGGPDDDFVTRLTLWDPDEATVRELDDAEASYSMTWTLDDRLVLWTRSGWQVVELTFD